MIPLLFPARLFSGEPVVVLDGIVLRSLAGHEVVLQANAGHEVVLQAKSGAEVVLPTTGGT